jgi:hypothetical protein
MGGPGGTQRSVALLLKAAHNGLFGPSPYRFFIDLPDEAITKEAA